MSLVGDVWVNTGYRDATNVLFGLECEIEAIRSWNEWVETNAIVTEDGSLRNNGREFLCKPKTRASAVEWFTNLHKNLVFRSGTPMFSARTSTHVHVNVQNLPMETVRTCLLLYALFEEFFFMMVEPSRRSNIHCVPLTETYLPSIYKNDSGSLVVNWHKYTALNLLPVRSIGTIEFRHMHGTNDSALMEQWLTLLENLITTAKALGKLSPEMLTQQAIQNLFSRLFSHVPQYLSWNALLPEKTFNSSLDIKLSF